LRRIALRQHECAARGASGQRHGERAAHRAQLAGERELAGEFLPGERVGIELAACGQDAERNRQVETAGVLRQLSGREVDRDAPRRELEVRVVERGAHAVARLPHFRIRQSDDVESRQPRSEVDFHAHLGRVDSGERAARHRGDGHETDKRRCGGAGLLARFQLGDARLELGELGVRALQNLLLHLEVLAHHQVEAVEPGAQERAQVFLDVLRGRVAQRFVDALAQLFEDPLVDHPSELTALRAGAAPSRTH
jgi:hypothetical protein